MIHYIAILDKADGQIVHSFWQDSDESAIKLCEDNHFEFIRCTLQTIDGRFVKEIM